MAGRNDHVPLSAAFLGLVVVLMAVGQASAGKMYRPPGGPGMSAAPPTEVLASLRTSSTALTSTLKSQAAQNIKTGYSTFLTAMNKAATDLTNTAKQNTFKANLDKILATSANTKLKWTAAPNKFTDMSTIERAKFLGSKAKGKRAASAKIASLRKTILSEAQLLSMDPPEAEALAISAESIQAAGVAAPSSTTPDWSLVLPDVKDQGPCGSCWAFGTTAVVEAGHFIGTGEVLPLSEKQLVDCNYNAVAGNWGCDGGWYDEAFKYVIKNGLAANTTYPYAPLRATCPAKLPAAASKLASYKGLPANDEASMLAALANGPIAVAVTADDAWFSYAGGVYSSTACSGTVNHAVVIVGAGVDGSTNTPYWLIRNSWGATWGEGGYIRLLRGAGGAGMCNVALFPFQATTGDAPSPPPPPPPPPSDCPKMIDVTPDTLLIDVAATLNASIAQIQLDNSLDRDTPFWGQDGHGHGHHSGRRGEHGRGGKWWDDEENGGGDDWWDECDGPSCDDDWGGGGDDHDHHNDDGPQQLLVNCSTGNWSQPFGTWNDGTDYNSRSQVPMVGTCPTGHYAVQFYVKPSSHYTANQEWTGSTWVGQITMTCSDGTIFTIDAQPSFDPGFDDGNITLMTGFTQVPLRSGWAIDSLFGVGSMTGNEGLYKCPPNTMVTGFSAGANGYPAGWVANLQFLCTNPFNTDVTKFKALQARATKFTQVRSGLACPIHVAAAADTWFTIATKYKVSPVELIRSNPGVKDGKITANLKLFIPPCSKGAIEGAMKGKGKQSVSVAAVGALPPGLTAHRDVPANVQYDPPLPSSGLLLNGLDVSAAAEEALASP